jgi:hypothetical protein
MFYHLSQDGEFVDFQTLEIFPAHLESSGSGPMFHLMAGADWWVHSRVGLLLDGRYNWASAKLSPDFSDVSRKINLRGFQVSTGLAVRF